MKRLAEQCVEGPFAEKCTKKRMEMVSMAESMAENVKVEMTEPILRETMTIMVDGKPQLVYKDVIEKEIYKELYFQLRRNPLG